MMDKFTPVEYIKIAIANAYGLDKETWELRLKWFNETLALGNIQACVARAAEPLLMQKAVNAYEDAMNDVPTGFLMNLDATASGIQLMACLIGCHKTAEAVNLIDTRKREDVYGTVAVKMGKTRGEVKPSVMTHFYGSKAAPKATFGDDLPEFYAAMDEMLPGACECMVDMQSCWQPNALEHEWTLPDGHTASVKVMTAVDKKIEIDEMDHATFTHRAYVNSAQESGLSLAANIIHSVDAYVVREVYRRCEIVGIELLTIHDSFWASPNCMEEVRVIYTEILAEIAAGNLMQHILREVTGNTALEYEKYSNDLGDKILLSNYALS